jgi:hypothetical protein
VKNLVTTKPDTLSSLLLAGLLAALLPACRKEAPAPPRPAAAVASSAAPAPAVAHSAAEASPGLAQMKEQHEAAARGSEAVEQIKVPRAGGRNGKTVEEVHAQRAALNGKEVAVRGKVVKIVRGVLGKNWIHLRDGTGSHAAKDDDLTITTTDDAAAGDLVLVRGTVGTDKDFGLGYTYPVMIENAKLSK